MKRLVLTIGTFDGLHVGHVNLIKKCRIIAGNDPVWVGLNGDQIAASRGKKLMQSYNQRRAVLFQLKDVNGTVAYNGLRVHLEYLLDYFKSTYEFDTFVIVVGSDWFGKYHKLMGFDQAWLDAYHVTVVYVDHTEGVSSTEWRKKHEPKRSRRR